MNLFPFADVVLEKAMHKCILKPLKGHIEAMLKEFHTVDGSWKQLKENLQLVRQRNPQELGVFVPTPDFVDVEKIKVKFMTMQKMYSPEKKVMLLLRVCKLIYTIMENNSGKTLFRLDLPALKQLERGSKSFVSMLIGVPLSSLTLIPCHLLLCHSVSV